MSHLFFVQLDIPAEHEAEFNRVYDTEHYPTLSKVPGVLRAARYRLDHSSNPKMARYLTLYEVESPAVLESQAWQKAAAFGDWIAKIRPLLTTRHHSVFERIPEGRSRMIHVVAIITAKPGMRGAILDAFRANMPAVHAEKGCIEYGPAIDAEGAGGVQTKFGPDTFVVIEKWESPEALRAHAASPHMAAYAAKTRDMIQSRVIHVLSPA